MTMERSTSKSGLFGTELPVFTLSLLILVFNLTRLLALPTLAKISTYPQRKSSISCSSLVGKTFLLDNLSLLFNTSTETRTDNLTGQNGLSGSTKEVKSKSLL